MANHKMYGCVSPPIEGHFLLQTLLYLMHKHTHTHTHSFTAAMYCLSNLRSLPFASNIASAYTSGSGKGGRQPSYKTNRWAKKHWLLYLSINRPFVCLPLIHTRPFLCLSRNLDWGVNQNVCHKNVLWGTVCYKHVKGQLCWIHLWMSTMNTT